MIVKQRSIWIKIIEGAQMKLKLITLMTLPLICSAVFANANNLLKISIQQALSTAEKAGCTNIRKVEFEHGQWEVKGQNANGKKVKVKIDATTGALSNKEKD